MRKHVWTILDVHKHMSSLETESYVIRREGKEIYSSLISVKWSDEASWMIMK